MGEDKIIKPVFDERTSRFLFEYYLLRVLINYIELADDEDMIVTEVVKETNVTDIFSVEYLQDIETKVDLSMTSRNKTEVSLLTGNKKELRQKSIKIAVYQVALLASLVGIILIW